MILVTGATGSAGGALVRELLDRGTKGVRAMARSEKDRSAIATGAEFVRGDFSDPASLTKALTGVDSAYLVCAPIPELVTLETTFLEACRIARLKHVVINSALGAEDFSKSFPSWHRKVEDAAKAMGLPITILRPNGFMQNIAAYFAPTISTQDSFYGTIGEARISLIDVRDVAAAAAEALTTGKTIGQTLELSGPEAISYPELAARISKFAGRPISYVNLTPDQMRQGITASGVPAERATWILELDEYYQSGKGAATDAALRKLLSRPPKTIDAYLGENKTLFQRPA